MSALSEEEIRGLDAPDEEKYPDNDSDDDLESKVKDVAQAMNYDWRMMCMARQQLADLLVDIVDKPMLSYHYEHASRAYNAFGEDTVQMLTKMSHVHDCYSGGLLSTEQKQQYEMKLDEAKAHNQMVVWEQTKQAFIRLAHWMIVHRQGAKLLDYFNPLVRESFAFLTSEREEDRLTAMILKYTSEDLKKEWDAMKPYKGEGTSEWHKVLKRNDVVHTLSDVLRFGRETSFLCNLVDDNVGSTGNVIFACKEHILRLCFEHKNFNNFLETYLLGKRKIELIEDVIDQFIPYALHSPNTLDVLSSNSFARNELFNFMMRLAKVRVNWYHVLQSTRPNQLEEALTDGDVENAVLRLFHRWYKEEVAAYVKNKVPNDKFEHTVTHVLGQGETLTTFNPRNKAHREALDKDYEALKKNSFNTRTYKRR